MDVKAAVPADPIGVPPRASQVKTLCLRPSLDVAAIALIGLVILAVSSFLSFTSDVRLGSLANPVAVSIEGLRAADRDAVSVTVRTPVQDQFNGRPEELQAFRTSEAFNWRLARTWVRGVHLHVTREALARIQRLDLSIGAQRFQFGPREIESWPRLSPMEWALPGATGEVVSIDVPWKKYMAAGAGDVLNWPARSKVVWRAVRVPLLYAAIAVCAGLWMRLRFKNGKLLPVCERILSGVISPAAEPVRPWFLVGALVVAAGIAITEFRQPFAFTEDDGVSQFLPVILQAARGMLAGHIPVWNPNQFMGAPTLTVGIYTLTYPPTYLAYGIARFLLGNELLTLEVFALLHFAAGYLVTFTMLRKLNLSPPLAASGSACFLLSGFFLIAARSQLTFMPLAVWAPVLMICVNRFAYSPVGLKWAVATGSIIGVLFHAGHAQMWVYTVMFFVLALVLTEQWKRSIWAIPALLWGAAIAAPLFVLQAIETSGIIREPAYGYGVGGLLLQMLLPLGRWGGDPYLLGTFNSAYNGQYLYSGTIFAGSCILAIGMAAGMKILTRNRIPIARNNIWLFCAAAALILSFGDTGIAWSLMSLLPVFDKFRWPFKFIFFFDLFAITAGALVVQRWARSRRAVTVLSCAAMVLILVHAAFPHPTWYSYADRLEPNPSRPVPPDSRILPVFPKRSAQAGYIPSMAHNYPTYAGVLAFAGYDSFVEGSKPNQFAAHALYDRPVEAARAYGLSWMTVHEAAFWPRYSENLVMWDMENVTVYGLATFHELRAVSDRRIGAGHMTLFHLPHAQPLAFSSSAPLAVSFDVTGAHVKTAGLQPGTDIVVNVLWRPWMKVAGRQERATPDDWGRVLVHLEKPADSLWVRYSPPWAMSFGAGGALLIIGILAAILIRKREMTCAN